MAAAGIMRERLAIWIFGPIGAGKSTLASRLPLAGFRLVDQDSELEREMEKAGLSQDTTTHSAEEHAHFLSLRSAVARSLWDRVPGWRAQGDNLCFETTGDKPHLFRAEVNLGHEHGYRSLGIALQTPLEECLARNRARRRVLGDYVVRSSWQAFQQFLADGTYASLFAADSLIVCSDHAALNQKVAAWLSACRLGGDDE